MNQSKPKPNGRDPKARHNDASILGAYGEQAATRYLEDNGYLIVERNYRAGKHEIDIIAFKDNELVVVEVKTRSGNDIVEPEEAVNHKKRQSLIYAANAYVQQKNRHESVRFDIITVIKKEGTTEIKHIKEAFNVLCF